MMGVDKSHLSAVIKNFDLCTGHICIVKAFVGDLSASWHVQRSTASWKMLVKIRLLFAEDPNFFHQLVGHWGRRHSRCTLYLGLTAGFVLADKNHSVSFSSGVQESRPAAQASKFVRSRFAIQHVLSK